MWLIYIHLRFRNALSSGSYSPKYNIVIINILKHINKYIVSTIIVIFLTDINKILKKENK